MDDRVELFSIFVKATNFSQQALKTSAQNELLKFGVKVRDENGLARKRFPLQGDVTGEFSSLLEAKAKGDRLGVDECTQKLWSQGVSVKFANDSKNSPPKQFAHLGDNLGRFAAGIKFRGKRKGR